MRLVVSCFVLAGLWSTHANAQVTVNPGGGSYASLSAAFTAINAGTHTGAITIDITGNTTEPATAVALLKSAAPSNYSSVTIRPLGGNWTINSAAAPTASRGMVELSGADNVTIDGDDPGTAGTRNLSFVVVTSASTGLAAIRLSSTSTTGLDGADNVTVKNCIITGSRASATVTVTNYGIVMSNSSSITTGAYSSLNTVIENNLITRCYRGIYAAGTSATYPNTGLRIRNNVLGNATAANNIGQSGVFLSYTSTTAGTSASAIIEGNDIRVGDGSPSGSGFSASVNGVELGTVNAGAIVRRNNLHDIYQPTVSGYGAYGIIVSGSTSCNDIEIYNNFIGPVVASKYSVTSVSSFVAYGIRYSAGATNQKINYNTIVLPAAVTGTVANYVNYGVAAAVAGVTIAEFKNNIIVNQNVGTGSYGFYTASTANLVAGAASNNNYYVTSGNVGYYNAANRITLSDWQTASGQDVGSFSVDPGFVSATDFHISPGSPAMNGVAVPVASITNDFDGDIRDVTTPDIGADEYTPLGCLTANGGTISPSMISACNGQVLTMTAVGASVGSGLTYTWEVSATSGSGFVPVSTGSGFNTVSHTTAPLTPGTYYYRLNVVCSNGPVTGLSNEVQVIVPGAMSGAYSIDNTGAGDYISFAAALADLNCRGASAAITFNVTAGQTFNETSNLECTYSGTVSNTITFQKNGPGANPLVNRIGTSGTTDYVVKLTGVDYYTFDGIDFGQTGSSAADWVEYGVWMTNSSVTNGAKNNTVKNGTISLSNANTSAKGVFVGSAVTPTALSGTQSNNRFLNMTVQNSWEGYRFTGATTTYMDDANEIGTESGGSSNILNMGDATGAVAVYGVFGTYQTNFKLQNTTINNLLPGTTLLVYGITLQTSASNSATISGNTFSNISGGGTIYGIYFSAGDTADIYNNTIYGFTSSGTASAVRGIYLSATGMNANIFNNRVYNLLSTGITTTSVAGIDAGTGIYNIYNNMVSDIKAPASTQTACGTRGISVSGGTASGVDRIYNNTVLLTDVGTVPLYTSAAFHNSSATPLLDIRNNIFINNSDISTGTRVAAFWKTAVTDNVESSCNNNLYYAGNPDPNHLIYYDGTNSADNLISYQSQAAIAPAEGASVTENTMFDPITNGIIRPDAGIPTYIEGGAQVSGLVPNDFEGDVRNASTPDMGADEGNFTQALPPPPGCSNYISPADMSIGLCSYQNVTLNWSASSGGGPATLGFDVYFGTSPSPAFVTNTVNLSYTPSGLLPNTTYYWQVIPQNAGGSASGCAIYSFTTADVQLTTTTPATRCGTGTVTLGAAGSGTITWYSSVSGNTQVGTGNTFITPPISISTDYYVSAGISGAPYVTARIASSNPGTATSLSTYGQIFTLTDGITLNAVDVFSSTGTAVVINLYNSAGTTLLQTTGTVPTPAGVQSTIPLGFSISPGTYRLHIVTTGNFYRENSGPVYPISLGGVGQINGFFSSLTGAVTTSASYYFMYNWNVTGVCASPRQLVTATVLPSTTYYSDADGDTYGDPSSPLISCSGAPSGSVLDNTDCNDGNAAVNPAATDVCNGIDDNCNGITDDGCALLTFYADADGDTYGNTAVSITQTNPVPPSGYVSDNTDCNDANNAAYPGATEVCNLIDDDCDALTDEGFDADGDGYTTCSGDCNDNNNSIFPGATEVCNGVDDNCNMLIDDGLTFITYYNDVDGDTFGDPSTAVSTCNGAPSGYITNNSDCNDNNAAVNPNAAEICNGIDDNCNSLTDDNVPALPNLGAVSGTATACLPGVAGSTTYSIAAVPGATTYVWSVPAGFTIASGQGTTSITVSWTGLAIQNGISGPLCVYAADACVSTSPACLTISYQIAAPVTPPSISGPGKACPGDVVMYSIATVARATSYTWTLPATMSVVSGQGTNTLTAQVNAGFTGGTLSVIASNVCGSSPSRTKALVQNLPGTPTAILGQKDGLCNTTGNVYAIAAVANATSYIWTINGGTITGGQGTTTITADVAALIGSGSVTVQAVNGCGTGAIRTLTLVGAPARAGVISGNVSVCDSTTEAYGVSTVAGAAAYTWTVTANGAVSGGQGTKNITIDWKAPGGAQSVSVVTSNACGTSLTRTLTGITVNNCVRLAGSQNSTFNMSAYPNPATDLVAVEFTAIDNSDYRMRIADMTGRTFLMETGTAASGLNTKVLPLNGLASGVYMISIEMNNKQQQIKLIVE